MHELQIKIDKIRSVLTQIYPDLICDISVKNNVLIGDILLEKQKKFILNQLTLVGVETEEDIKVLTSFKVKPKYGWGSSASSILNIIKSPANNWDKLSPRGQGQLRETQVIENDLPFRLIYKKNDWYLVQLLDKSIGWVPANEVKGSKPGKKPKTIQFDENKFISVINIYSSTPYLWGGNTADGIDCSGLIQRVFLESMNLLLPKHSQDQKKIGRKINIENIEIGDLVFAKSIDKNISHVAIYIGGNQITHACLRLKTVSSESIDNFEKYYKVDDIVRIKEVV